MDLVTNIYTLTSKLPKDEAFALCSQMRRAAVSIPSNIAEGYERNSVRDYIKFLHVALGSNAELQTQLEICVRVEYLTREDIKDIYTLSREVSRILSKTITTLQNK
jgi:four helix bundle protein